MFSTKINHILQQLDNPILFWFMVVISALGTIPAVLSLVSAIAYGVDLKKGLILINIIAWTSIFTFVGKDQVNFPRPIDVDSQLKTIYYTAAKDDLSQLQPIDFFDTFSEELLDKTRNDEYVRYGFPSGHTSVQFALWISLIFLFKKRWILISGIAMVLLTMFSRIYLGHHFLGDVIGGMALGIIVTCSLIVLIKKTNYLGVVHQQFKSLSILWAPIFLVPFINYIPTWLIGGLIGLNASAILLIQYKNFPVFHILPVRRVLATIIGTALILLTFYMNKTILIFESKVLELIVISIVSFLTIGSSFLLCQRLNLIRFRF